MRFERIIMGFKTIQHMTKTLQAHIWSLNDSYNCVCKYFFCSFSWDDDLITLYHMITITIFLVQHNKSITCYLAIRIFDLTPKFNKVLPWEKRKKNVIAHSYVLCEMKLDKFFNTIHYLMLFQDLGHMGSSHSLKPTSSRLSERENNLRQPLQQSSKFSIHEVPFSLKTNTYMTFADLCKAKAVSLTNFFLFFSFKVW